MKMPADTAAQQDVLAYRADIDGIRAIAVLAVMAFHLSNTLLPGGYLGVDMFFVLSGYLITGIIWQEAKARDFSFLRFYQRRIRRLLPVLVLVLVVTSGLAAILLLPTDLIGYGKSLLSTLVFSANIYFWRDTTYFSRAAEQKPLLHIWSLGVEEQFYVFFPILIVLLARYFPRRAFVVVAVMVLLSFLLQIALSYIGQASPAFFLLPPRVWELGVGALLAITAHPGPGPQGAAAASILGLGIILVALLAVIPQSSLIPAAFPAVVGTALVVWAGVSSRPAVNRLLSRRPIVLVGLLSYSLYLWHWPIIVFCRYFLVRDLTAPESILVLGTVFLVAAAGFRHVEQPFRSRKKPFRAAAMVTGFATLVLGLAGSALILADGLPNRLNPQAAIINAAVGTTFRCGMLNFMPYGLGRACPLNLAGRDPMTAELVLLGNSHAQMYAPVWRDILAAANIPAILVPLNRCLPTVSANLSPACIAEARRNLGTLLSHQRARVVVVGLTWDHGPAALVDARAMARDNTGNLALASALDDLIARLRAAGKTVVLIGPIAIPGVDIASITSRELAFGWQPTVPDRIPKSEFLARYQTILDHFSGRDDLVLVRPDQEQCDRSSCYFIVDGKSLFADENHFAAAAVSRFRTRFEAGLAQAERQGRDPE